MLAKLLIGSVVVMLRVRHKFLLKNHSPKRTDHFTLDYVKKFMIFLNRILNQSDRY